MKPIAHLVLVVALMVTGCRPRNVVAHAPVMITPEQPVAVVPLPPPPADEKPKHPYRASQTRTHDLEHTRLDVKFDWNKSRMHGKARLRLRPLFYPTDQLVLDAKGFYVHEVALMRGSEKTPLKYKYDDFLKLEITLDRKYTRTESFEVFIDYTTRTTELAPLMEEVHANDQGLYWINPKGDDPDKPQQIWTQGEVHGSPGWFPTLDQPNERCTQEINMTVDAKYVTLSNGILVNSRRNDDGTRTDFWRMNLPHAPYLFMMAVGDFAVVKDKWRGKEVSYYVEPEYKKYARMIFGNTPEMLEFFSNKLGMEYPWEKYAQIVVRDFVSGAMENTTATVHMAALQHDAREHLDYTYEDYISHELFHQWFGDLLTCESWANLTLNEGFATYGEYLWKEYKYGKDRAEAHLAGDRRSYLNEARREKKNLVRYHHDHADDMFDAHSYQKGGLVLHMLRKVVGEEAFFASIKEYLHKNAFTAVELAELRMAFEDVSGQDLNWFFDQWFLRDGHPVLKLDHTLKDGKWLLTVEQIQAEPAFRFPVRVEVGSAGQVVTHDLWVTSRDTTFALPVSGTPDYVAFDADGTLLHEVERESKTADGWIAQLKAGRNYIQKRRALDALEKRLGDAGVQEKTVPAVLSATDDSYHGTRAMAIGMLAAYAGPQREAIARRALTMLADSIAAVRVAAVDYLRQACAQFAEGGALADAQELRRRVVAGLKVAIGDSSYSVERSAFMAYACFDTTAALEIAREIAPRAKGRMATAIGELFKARNAPETLDFIRDKVRDKASPGMRAGLLRRLDDYLLRQDAATQAKGTELLMTAAKDDPTWWVRYSAVRSLTPFLNKQESVKAFFEAQTEGEENKFVRELYKTALEE